MEHLRDRIKKHRPIAAAAIISLLFAGGGWLWAFLALRRTEQPLILHFNNLAGIDQVGSLRDLMPIGVFGVVLVILGSFIALELDERDWFLGKFAAAATLGFAVLIFIGFAAIVSVN